MWEIKCLFYFKGICKIRKAPRACRGQYNLIKLLSNPRGGCGDIQESPKLEGQDKDEYRCFMCNRKMSAEEYLEHGGLCRQCRGGPTQNGFPSPPGFPKM